MPSHKTFQVEEPFLKLECTLGEGPYWEESGNILRFVDINRNQLHAVDLNVGPSSHKIIAEIEAIATTADVAGSDPIIAFGGMYGYGLFNKDSKTHKYIKKVWSEHEVQEGKDQKMRANDGRVDRRGRFWLGMMNHPLITEIKPEGKHRALFRLDSDLKLHRIIDGVSIPNGISWTSDDKTMYFTDSKTQSIFAYDFEVETGSIANRREFFRCTGPGVPDGHAQDELGNLWVAIWGEGKVLQISPAGLVLAEIILPARLVTCPVFADQDLYITSAAEREPHTYPESAKYGGSLFKCHVGMTGMKPHRFRLDDNVARP